MLATDASPSGCQSDAHRGGGRGVGGGPRGGALAVHLRDRRGQPRRHDPRRARPACWPRPAGPSTPFILNDSAADLGTRFLDALNAIRGSALPCELRIPRPTTGMIDFNKVNVRFTGAAGADDLLYVAAAPTAATPARGGWYYDVEPGRGTPSTRAGLRGHLPPLQPRGRRHGGAALRLPHAHRLTPGPPSELRLHLLGVVALHERRQVGLAGDGEARAGRGRTRRRSGSGRRDRGPGPGRGWSPASGGRSASGGSCSVTGPTAARMSWLMVALAAVERAAGQAVEHHHARREQVRARHRPARPAPARAT